VDRIEWDKNAISKNVKIAQDVPTLYDYENRRINTDYWHTAHKSLEMTLDLPDPDLAVRGERNPTNDGWTWHNNDYERVNGYYGYGYHLWGSNWLNYSNYAFGDSFTFVQVFRYESLDITDHDQELLNQHHWSSGTIVGVHTSLRIYNETHARINYGVGDGNSHSVGGFWFNSTEKLKHWIMMIIRHSGSDSLLVRVIDLDMNETIGEYSTLTQPYEDSTTRLSFGIWSYYMAEGYPCNLSFDVLFVYKTALTDEQIDVLSGLMLLKRPEVREYFRKYSFAANETTTIYQENGQFVQLNVNDSIWGAENVYVYFVMFNVTVAHYHFDEPIDEYATHGWVRDALYMFTTQHFWLDWSNNYSYTADYPFEEEDYNYVGDHDYGEMYRAYWVYANKEPELCNNSINKTYPIAFKMQFNGTHCILKDWFNNSIAVNSLSDANHLRIYVPPSAYCVVTRNDLGGLHNIFKIVTDESVDYLKDPLGLLVIPYQNIVLTRNLYVYNRLDTYAILNVSNNINTFSVMVAPHTSIMISLPVNVYDINNQTVVLDRDYAVYLDVQAYKLYISFYNQWTGLGVGYETFLTYVNGERAFYPENYLTTSVAWIQVYDFFGRMLYNRTIVLNETEYAVGIGIYLTTLGIINNANYTVRVNISYGEKVMSLELGPSMFWELQLVSDKYNVSIEKKINSTCYEQLGDTTEVDLSQYASATITIATDIAELVTPVSNYTLYNFLERGVSENIYIKYAVAGIFSGLASGLIFYLFWVWVQKRKKKLVVVKVSPW